ncbi:hypothetical protein GALMADRAFT_242475 [Galerina marginata CBS 339.88]|uniref:Uncharacterized protein n=1 Tax=Galerina marginata (strain CBS 339.88) TaxID=685588 RepID=A0A067TAE8_GALM3|nr:hypothetical protein GALMADRAFT_242475 [Galerina marginata CBS 339.88]
MATAHASALHSKPYHRQPGADADEPELHAAHRHHPHHPTQDPAHHKTRGLPAIPDLRFESSYVRSVQGYVSVERVDRASFDVDLDGQEGREDEDFETVDAGSRRESKGKAVVRKEEKITVQWNKVLWVTVRDQVVSPLLQGALWALASYYVRPFSAELGSKMGTFVRGGLPTIRKEGSAVSWLRGWAKSIGLSGLTSGGGGGGSGGQRTSS